MSYAGNFLKSRGKPCSIVRVPPIQSYASMKRSSKSITNIGTRDAAWEGLILADAGLTSGEVFTIGSVQYLVQSVDNDPESSEDIFFCVKTNADLVHMRFDETLDENNNVIQAWVTKNSDVPAYGQVVTAKLRQAEPGLLDTTKFVFQVPKAIAVIALDRIIFGEGPNNKYQVESVDDIGLSGISQIQLSSDNRPD